MAVLTVVVGLPGAGKSHFIRDAFPKLIETQRCAEDFMAHSINSSSRMRDSKHFSKLVGNLRAGHDWVIADIEFCRCEKRAEMEWEIRKEVPGIKTDWRYFANDLAQCAENIERRNSPDRCEQLKKACLLSHCYLIPSGATIMDVWRPATPPSDVLA